ncbi:hypothetical protein E2C01_082976 [Portunus trituberculatus]|uniref:Uncharacterized protein n=1 Tax=Portunus trituberculatus TaxID=210409 RepID=A0A5B7J285_PORTR|nr:hypothetical protein [Portunus trituberculatus]
MAAVRVTLWSVNSSVRYTGLLRSQLRLSDSDSAGFVVRRPGQVGPTGASTKGDVRQPEKKREDLVSFSVHPSCRGPPSCFYGGGIRLTCHNGRRACRVSASTCSSSPVVTASSPWHHDAASRDAPPAGNDARSSSNGKLMHLRPSCQTSGCDADTELKISVGGACGGGDGPVMD